MEQGPLISFTCSFCHARLKARPGTFGKHGKCPKCGKPITVEKPGAEPVAEPRPVEQPRAGSNREPAPREGAAAPVVERPQLEPIEELRPVEQPRTGPRSEPAAESNWSFAVGTHATKVMAVEHGIVKPADKVGLGLLKAEAAPAGEVTLKGAVTCGACTVPGFSKGPELPFEARADWNAAGGLVEVECPKCKARMGVSKTAKELNGKSTLFLCVSRLIPPANPAFGASETDAIAIQSVDGQPVRRE